jgi:hypothetical protein
MVNGRLISIFTGHAIGSNAVSWAPAIVPRSLTTPQAPTPPGQAPSSPFSIKHFAGAGCDNLVKMWGYRDDSQSWVEEDSETVDTGRTLRLGPRRRMGPKYQASS